ncbi:MAG: TenA family protein [Ardenticatenales bacterium]|nr:TenA family protein [Ardenticatenales bacterium]
MTLSGQLWQNNLALAHSCRNHPFIQGIGDGSLDPRRFARYIAQDACFLEATARAYSLAAAKAPDWEGVKAFHALAGATLDELHLHEQYAASLNVDIQRVMPEPATRRYIDFLMAMTWGHDVGIAATAMAPCVRLYAFLGQELARNGLPEHRYSHWIGTYSAPGIEALAQRLEGLVDRYVALPEQATSTYRYAMLCEQEFFHAAWEEEG